MKNRRIINPSAPMTLGFSNWVTPNGAMTNGKRNKRTKIIEEATIFR